MKKLLFLVVVMGCVCLISQSAFAQCNPKSTMIPAFQIRGDLSCFHGANPDTVMLDWFKVDGVICATENVEWVYPFAGAGTYQLQFWLDNTTDHTLSICVTTTCTDQGSLQTFTGGFSADGVTPGACDDTADFPTGSSAIPIDIVTPVQLSSFTATAQ